MAGVDLAVLPLAPEFESRSSKTLRNSPRWTTSLYPISPVDSPGCRWPNGFLVSAPLALLAVADWRAIWRDAGARRTACLGMAAAAGPGVGMLIYSGYLGSLTGHPLAWMEAHQAWGRVATDVAGLFTERADIIANQGFYTYSISQPIELVNATFVIASLILAVAPLRGAHERRQAGPPAGRAHRRRGRARELRRRDAAPARARSDADRSGQDAGQLLPLELRDDVARVAPAGARLGEGPLHRAQGQDARLPPVRLAGVVESICDKGERDASASLFGDALRETEGAERPLKQALEAADVCIALRARRGGKFQEAARRRQQGQVIAGPGGVTAPQSIGSPRL